MNRERTAALDTPSGLSSEALREIPPALMALLADVFALYVKTKNFHWHMSGPHFRDHHQLLDEQASQLYEITDAIAERARKIGGTTLRSIGHIARLQRRLKQRDVVRDYVSAHVGRSEREVLVRLARCAPDRDGRLGIRTVPVSSSQAAARPEGSKGDCESCASYGSHSTSSRQAKVADRSEVALPQS